MKTMLNHIAKNLAAAVLLVAPVAMQAQSVAINDNGNTAAATAILDLDFSGTPKKGMLAPRMTGAQRVAIGGLGLVDAGLLVYQTTSPTGYWFWDGGAWLNIYKGVEPWGLQGNALTVPATNFVGSINNDPVSIRTAGTERIRVNTNGRVGVGTAAPNERLEVNGGLKITNTSATDDAGTIRWNATLNTHEGNIDGTPTGWYELENVFQERVMQNYEMISGGCNPTGSDVVTGGLLIGAGATSTFGTIEGPYATGWEDHRVQYMWRASELGPSPGAGMCANQDINGIAFSCTSATTTQTMNNAAIKMLQVAAPNQLVNFEYGPSSTVWSNAAFSPVSTPAGADNWIKHSFSNNYQWNGTSHLIVEFCFDNSTWTSNRQVRADNQSWAALYGLFCDACGGTGAVPCGTPPIVGNGARGGCDLISSSNLVTCDGSFQWNGGQASRNKRPRVKFFCFTGNQVIVTLQDDYIYTDKGVLIGDPGAAWAQAAGPPYAFKGPGTIHAERQVWGPSLLNDHVFDLYFDGTPHPLDVEKVEGYRHYPIDEMVNYVETERHLPSIEGREEWKENGMFSLDELGNQLWVTVEQQALYIKELNERMQLLEKHLVRQQLQD